MIKNDVFEKRFIVFLVAYVMATTLLGIVCRAIWPQELVSIILLVVLDFLFVPIVLITEHKRQQKFITEYPFIQVVPAVLIGTMFFALCNYVISQMCGVPLDDFQTGHAPAFIPIDWGLQGALIWLVVYNYIRIKKKSD